MRYMSIFVALFCCLLLGSKKPLSTESKCHKKMNVEEAFMSIPSDMFPIVDDDKGPIVTRSTRRKQIAKKDLKNGFLELQNKTIISQTIISLFVEKSGYPMVLATADGVSVQKVYGFRCLNARWENQTEAMLPSMSLGKIATLYQLAGITVKGQPFTEEGLGQLAHSKIRYVLPREGKVVKIFAGHPDFESVLLEERVFDGETFIIMPSKR